MKWTDFNNKGGNAIKAMGPEDQIDLGGTEGRPQVRLRHLAAVPKSAAKVPEERRMLFTDYKGKRSQVRALLMTGNTAIIGSLKVRVLADRHPQCPKDLIRTESARRKGLETGLAELAAMTIKLLAKELARANELERRLRKVKRRRKVSATQAHIVPDVQATGDDEFRRVIAHAAIAGAGHLIPELERLRTSRIDAGVHAARNPLREPDLGGFRDN